MLFLKVPKKQAEKVRRELMGSSILVSGYQIHNEGDFVLIPVTSPYGKYELAERDAIKHAGPPKRLKDALAGKLTEEELRSLTTSFDLIGDIAIVEIPEGVERYENEIGKALLQVHPNLRTVLKKLGPMEGEYRVRKLSCIAGEDKTETIYKESGILMKLDLSKVYFSVRLSTERKRIADLVQDGERVLVLFAGVGPFALVISKKRRRSAIVAVEINPVAVEYMKKNITLNRLENIEPVLADARSLKIEESSFDHVVMPLPKSAVEFLDIAFASVKDGGTVHLYTMADIKDPYKDALARVEDAARVCHVSLKPESMRIVRPYSPALVQVVLDLKVSKNVEDIRQAS